TLIEPVDHAASLAEPTRGDREVIGGLEQGDHHAAIDPAGGDRVGPGVHTVCDEAPCLLGVVHQLQDRGGLVAPGRDEFVVLGGEREVPAAERRTLEHCGSFSHGVSCLDRKRYDLCVRGFGACREGGERASCG